MAPAGPADVRLSTGEWLVAGHDVAVFTDAEEASMLIVHGVELRLTGCDRTVIDLWRYPRKIPREYALEALRRCVKADGFETPKFARLARNLEVWDKIEPVAQGLVMR